MNIKPFAYLLCLFMLAYSVLSYTCYQESVNVSTVCGGVGNGTYGYNGTWLSGHNWSLTIDGDWDTYGTDYCLDTKASTAFENWTHPLNSTNSTIYEFDVSSVIYATTLPQSCWIEDPIQIALSSQCYLTYKYGTQISCWNATEWQPIYTTDYLNRGIYESAMSWWLTDAIDDCSAYTTHSLNFSLFLEDYPTTALNASISYAIYTENPDGTESLAYSASNSNTNKIALCTNSNAVTPISLYLQTIPVAGQTHRFYLSNWNISNATQTFFIYNFNYTAGLSILQLTIRDYYTNDYVPNVIVKLQRYYPGTATWLTVQEYKTDDFGLAIFNIEERTADYRILLYDTDNNLLASANSMAFSCNAYTALGQGVCQLTYQLNNQTATTPTANIIIIESYNATANAINISWSDMASGTNTVQTTVTTQSYTGSSTICDTTQTGSSGTNGCHVSGYSGPVMVIVYVNGNIQYSEYQDLNTTMIGANLSPYEGSFWSAMIIITCMMFGIAISPAAGFVSIMVGLIAIYAMGLFAPLTISFLIVAGVVSIAIGWRLRA